MEPTKENAVMEGGPFDGACFLNVPLHAAFEVSRVPDDSEEPNPARGEYVKGERGPDGLIRYHWKVIG